MVRKFKTSDYNSFFWGGGLFIRRGNREKRVNIIKKGQFYY